MCLITLSRNGDLLDFDLFKESHLSNDDGTGIMFVDRGQLQVLKVVSTSLDDHYKIYEQAKGYPHAIHQRMATHGSRSISMCHPYRVLSKESHGTDLYVMHNGVLSFTGAHHEQGSSDTHLFIKHFLRPILRKNPDLLYNKGFKRMLTQTIGGGNKLLFMSNTGIVTIINKSQGFDKDNFWFSNRYSIRAFNTVTIPFAQYHQNYQGRHHSAYFGRQGSIPYYGD